MYREERNEKPTKKRGILRKIFSLRNELGQWHLGRILTGLIILSLFLVIFFGTMFYTVGVGHGILIVDPLQKGEDRISGPIIGPSWAIKMPWQGAIDLYLATDSLGMWGDGTDKYANFPAIECFSKDQLEMRIDVMVRWQLDPSKIEELYRSYPQKNWKDTTIASVIREQIRLKTKGYSAIQTIEERDVVRYEIMQAIVDKLMTEPSLKGAIINIEFELRNIGYPLTYTQAIEAKLAAEQSKIQAEYEAQRTITLATAEAQALLIGANATAQQKIIDAEGIKQAIGNLIEGHNITDADYMDFLRLYAYLKTLETLAESEGVYFIVGIEDGNIFLQPSP